MTFFEGKGSNIKTFHDQFINLPLDDLKMFWGLWTPKLLSWPTTPPPPPPPDFTFYADPRFEGSSCRHSWYLPLHPWITRIVRRVMLNLAALSLLTPTSSTSPDPFLVNMVNLVPTSDGLCGNFALILKNVQRTPGCLLKQPYFPWHTLEGFLLNKKPVEVKITKRWNVSISAHRHRVPWSR